jgi:prepilin-type N-terminal cleavage/methylation domain-containing protein
MSPRFAYRAPTGMPLHAGDAGVTIIELLVAMAILAIILTAISLSITESLANSRSTQASVDRSNLVEFTARRFGPDVASSPAPATAHGGPAPAPCPAGNSDNSAVDIPVNPAASGTTVSYVVVAGINPASSALYRRTCTGSTLVGQQRLGSTHDALTASASCLPDGVTCRTVTLTLSWPGIPGSNVSLRSDRRAN